MNDQPLDTVRHALVRAEEIARSISALRDALTGGRAEQTNPVQCSEYGGVLGDLQTQSYSVLDSLNGAERDIKALVEQFTFQLRPAAMASSGRLGSGPGPERVRDAY